MAIDNKKPAPMINDITLKSIDQSVVNWFSKDFPVEIDGRNIPVIYATAERWARIQNEKGYRDENGILILPLISIRRTTPDSHKERYAPDTDETCITLFKRISTDPLGNERQSAYVANRIPDDAFLSTKDKAVIEVVTLPYPSFVNLDYEVTIWTSYMTHQNLEQENISSQFAGGRQWFYVGDYYFFATLKGSVDKSNLEDFSDKEKIIKYQFNIAVQAYLIDKDKIKVFRTPENIRAKFSERSIEL